ncbi:MAG: helical backbone metal receptor [Acidobacteriota bacterium]
MLTLLWTLLAVAAPPAKRVVSTAPSFTETMYAIGAGDQVVAVSTYCHYPPAVEKLPRVGNYLQPNIEAIARLQPDLVLVHAEQPEALVKLARLKIPTLALRNTTLEETLVSAMQIGNAIGMPQAGAKLERDLRGKLAAIEKKYSGKPRTLLFVVGRTPGRLDGMIAVGSGSYLNDLIRIAGGKNVLFDSKVAYPRISLESIIRLDPDVIVDMGDMAETVGVTEEHKRSVVKLWESQNAVRAAAERHVFAVAADIFVVPGPRVTQAAEAFATMMHEGTAR